jgi:hypothetical protein
MHRTKYKFWKTIDNVRTYLEIQLSRSCSSDRSLRCMQRRDVLITWPTRMVVRYRRGLGLARMLVESGPAWVHGSLDPSKIKRKTKLFVKGFRCRLEGVNSRNWKFMTLKTNQSVTFGVSRYLFRISATLKDSEEMFGYSGEKCWNQTQPIKPQPKVDA